VGGDQAEEAAPRRLTARVTTEELKALVRSVPDFPAPGILFRDITSLIAHPEGLSATLDHLVEAARPAQPSAVAGIEARGFILGAAIAARLGLGFILLRKPGKLPVATIGIDYDLEYGTERLEIDPTAISVGSSSSRAWPYSSA
jgi:adenine phosphoribosyltransferase